MSSLVNKLWDEAFVVATQNHHKASPSV